MKVVIVEDSPHESEIYEAAIKSPQVEVVVVNDPKLALDIITKEQPNLIVLDIQMPELDGITLSRIIRGHSDVPIIFLTGTEDKETVIAAVSIGPVEFLTKPISAAMLANTVHSYALVNWATDCLKPAKDELTRIQQKYKEI